jgi:hypothetical protein
MKKIRLFALAGLLGMVALTGAESSEIVILPPEDFCMCACPNGGTICVSAINGDCAVPCQQAMQYCPSDM